MTGVPEQLQQPQQGPTPRRNEAIPGASQARSSWVDRLKGRFPLLNREKKNAPLDPEAQKKAELAQASRDILGEVLTTFPSNPNVNRSRGQNYTTYTYSTDVRPDTKLPDHTVNLILRKSEGNGNTWDV